jgi:hypothetical protein
MVKLLMSLKAPIQTYSAEHFQVHSEVYNLDHVYTLTKNKQTLYQQSLQPIQ